MTRRILRYPVDDWVDPQVVFETAFADKPYVVWLDSGVDAVSGTSYLASASDGARLVTASVVDGTVAVGPPGADAEQREGSILDFLSRELDGTERVDARDPGIAEFALGWVGWLGYESGAAANHVPVAEARTPDAALLFVDRAIAFDHRTRTIELIALDTVGEDNIRRAQDWADATRAELLTVRDRIPQRSATRRVAGSASTALRWRHDDDHYLELIRTCQEAIRRGDAYQLCLTNEAVAEVQVDPVEAYVRLRASSPTHHGGFVRFGEVALLSASPEQFLSITPAGRIRTKPIKGTRPRGTTVSRDLELRAELEASEKERAENVMIVDLMRNDLGRVCAVGSVEVHHLLAVESYAQVHQLVSTVEGTLADGVGSVDAIAACFPAGSMTGTPKLSAMRILNRLEEGPRGIYSGCFGYIGIDGSVDLAMVIRSIVVTPGRVSIGSGGGITALSVPAEELDEVAVKASALIAALGL